MDSDIEQELAQMVAVEGLPAELVSMIRQELETYQWDPAQRHFIKKEEATA